MRILHVTAGIGRSNGVMSVILNYARHMPEDIQFDVLYFVETEDDRAAELEALDGHATLISRPGLHSFRKDDVDEYLTEHRGEYSAMHLHLPYLACVMAPKARRAGIPRVITHCHSSRFSLESGGWRNRILNIPTKWLADDLIACGRDAGIVWYGKRAVEQKKVWVLPNAIECAAYRYRPDIRQKVREELGIDGHLAVGHVGTLTTPKNHKFLLPVFAEIRKRRPDALLLLVGDGFLREQIEAQSAELGIRNEVLFLGNRSDVPDLLQAMDVFVFPSLHEGLPVSVVEAQAAGLPVIMSDTVTDEVCVTEHILRLPFALGPTEWAEQVLLMRETHQRGNCMEQIITGGFDLEDSASKLADFYRRG